MPSTAVIESDPQPIRHVHLLGICGTAMAALAGCLQGLGMRVTGSDTGIYPPMSDLLAGLGIPVREGYRPEHIPPDTELVIVGNVIREDNPEAREVRRRGLPFLSMAEAIGRFAIGERHAITIVGTHGKTTTTALAAHVLTELGVRPGYLVGGVARNSGTNFAMGGGDAFVIEGDEYDTAYFDKTPKFFKYRPRTVLFTSLEFDHGDIYPDLDAIRVHFARLLEGLPREGLVIACGDDPNVRALLPHARCPVVTYGLEPGANCRLVAPRTGGEGTAFESEWEGHRSAWRIPLAGAYNALNAAAVIVLARRLGHGEEAVQRALSSFLGVKRRQEVRGEAGGVTVIDDFAHHPTAVRLTIGAIAERYRGRRLLAVFEPRSFTARSDRFQNEFAAAFLGAQRVVLAPPFRSSHPGGSRPLDTEALATELRRRGVAAAACESTDAVLSLLDAETRPGDVVLVMSNGGFDNLHQRLLDALRSRPNPRPLETRAP